MRHLLLIVGPCTGKVPPKYDITRVNLMKLKSKLAASAAVLGLGATMAVAEGLERVNLDTSFMYEAGNYAEFSYGAVNPSIPATKSDGTKVSSVADRFTVNNFAAKTQIGENIDIGLWRTNNSFGVGIDWTSDPSYKVKADLTVSALVGLVKYKLSDNFSVLAGLKNVRIDSGASLKLPYDATFYGDYSLGSATTTVGVYGVAYERPEIALRVELVSESEKDMTASTNYSTRIIANDQAVASASGNGTISLGDAMTLKFQTGIAANTLLFGSVRSSKWKNNQVIVPIGATPTPVSTFGDGNSYTIGLGRKFSDTVSGTVSYFSDPSSGSCVGVSALAPTCENQAISLGAKIAMADNMDISLGTTWSRRGKATVSLTGAPVTDKSVVTSLGAKLSYKF